MAGLLDFEDPQQAGLLAFAQNMFAAGAPQTRRVGIGEALAGGLGGMQQAQLQAEMLKRKKAQDDMEMQVNQMKFGQIQQQVKDQESMRQRAAMMPQIIAKFGDDYQGMIKAGIDPALVKNIAESKNFGRSKVARTLEVSGEGGKKMQQQFDEYGNPVGNALDGYVAPERIDLGDQIVFGMPTVGAAFKKGMSAAEKDASARGWAGFNLQKDQQYKPQWNNEVGAFIAPPSKMNPQGQKIELAGYTKEEKPLTEVQAKAVTFASRMKNANDIVNELSGLGVDKSSAGKKFVEAVPFIGGGLGSIYNTTLPENIQKLDQAKRDWINANLRNESGAAIGKDEFYSADQQYFPQIGDKAEVIKQKAINRKLAEDGMRSQAGRGSMKIDSIVGGVKLPSTGGWSIQKVD